VASIAFGREEPVVDGNVRRVLARWTTTIPPRREEALWADGRRAGGDRRRPGDLNQALMELGATLCTPRNPRCSALPAAGEAAWPGCRAALAGDPESHPPPRRRRAVERQRRLVALVEDAAGRLLLFRRAEGADLLAGTWELPWVPWQEDGPAEEARAADPGAALASRYGGRWRLGGPLATARHAITFRDIELVAYRAAVEGATVEGTTVERTAGEGDPAIGGAGWHRRPALAGLALSSMVGKVLAAVDAAVAATREADRRR
jgi:A/G-specific adenine glycosylase